MKKDSGQRNRISGEASLTRPFDRHLDSDELNAIVASAIVGEIVGGRPVEQAVEGANRHVEACQECRQKVQMHKSAQSELARLKMPGTPEGPDCIGETEWVEVAAGVTPIERAEGLLKHAAQCGHCGPLLLEATDLLNVQTTKEEAERMRALPSSQADWQANLVQRLADLSAPNADTHSPSPATRLHFSPTIRGRLYTAALALALVSVVVSIAVWRTSPSYTNKLLAQAYTEKRTVEVRIPGARFAEPRVSRGAQASTFSKPASLLEAEGLIARGIARKPSIDWFGAKVRADLLDGNVDAALETAKSALQSDPESASSLNDLGSAYLERGRQTDAAIDFGEAYEYLSKALEKKPDDLVFLFNRAIASEHLHLYSQAESDWKRYLASEADPEWRSEAQKRLETIQHILNRESSDNVQPNLDRLTETLSSHDEQRILALDLTVESYQDLAIERWIPELLANELDARKREGTETALRLLADDLRLRHQDLWFFAFLNQGSSRFDQEAIRPLLGAIRASKEGDQASAIRLAAIAQKEFARERNEAGELRARFQEIYANRLAAHAQACYGSAKELIRESEDHNYTWLAIQARLEAAGCANDISRTDEAVRYSKEALIQAQNAHYASLQLRASAFVADSITNTTERLDILQRGLDAFWNGPYDSMRGYGLYAAIDYTSGDELQLWRFNEAAIKEGLHLIRSDPDLALRGLEIFRLARAQLAIDETDQAQQSIVAANDLLSRSHASPLAVGAAVDLADAFVLKGRYSDALNLLDSTKPRIDELSHDFTVEKFYATRGAALIGVGRAHEAEEILLAALKLARKRTAAMSRESERLEWVEALAPVYRSLTLLRRETDPESAFHWWEQFKGASLVGADELRNYSDSPTDGEPNLPTFPAWKNDRTLFLSYATFAEGTVAWAYDGERIRERWIPISVKQAFVLAHQFSKACSDPQSNATTLVAQGRELYGLLLKPVADWTQGRSRLIVETDESLQEVPFEALVDEQGKYLADSFDIEYSPGIFYINAADRADRIDRHSRALVIAESGPDNLDHLPALPEAQQEAKEVASRFDSTVLLSGNDATLPRVLNALPNSTVVHFVGHSIASAHVNGLVLADSPNANSRFLAAKNLSQSALHNVRLLVLSACSTANGTGTGVNDRESLARTALASGVPTVIGSRWPVDSVASAAWMRLFYASILDTGAASTSAKQARLAIRNIDRWRHPFYWASFTVFV
jgi:CHAT domain-containing protein